MRQMETGLRHRLRRAVRQMASQHQHLRALIESIEEASEIGQVAKVQESVDRLRGAIEAHFSLEDDIFFPALHGLHPETGRELNALMREHADYLEELARLRAELEADTLDAFAEGFEVFSRTIAAHECREERLVASLAGLFDAIR
jgi:iron-sulfur cluster repair protein YtfE (RIC family)